MDTNQILTLTVFVVVITIVGTIALAAVGYFAFRLRERRDPVRPALDESLQKPYFFERVRLPEHESEPPEHDESQRLEETTEEDPATTEDSGRGAATVRDRSP